MNSDTLVIVAAALGGVALVAYLTRKAAPNAAKPPTSSAPNSSAVKTQEIPNTALPGDAGWGWHYYTDGTSIDPAGNYYSGGTLVYAAGGSADPSNNFGVTGSGW
jgi:hypothetical protein